MTVDPPSSLTVDGLASPVGGSPRKAPSLQRELLANLALLVAAALALAMATALVAQALRPAYAFILLMGLVAADAGLVFAFGHYLLRRLVLARLAALRAAAEELAAGNLQRRVPPAETREFAELGECFNRMTDRLLDIQGQLVRSEKLATVGRLAAGVAHEVGNPLAALGTYLEVLRRRGTDAEVLAAAEHELGRIDRIIRGLLDYARPGEDRLARVDLASIIRSALELLERQGVLKGVDLRLQLEEAAFAVFGRAHALEQVVVNLVLNAIDAAPQGPVVVGAVRSRFVERPELARRRSDGPDVPGPSARRRLGGAAQRRPWRPEVAVGAPGVLVYVTDAGPGVPPAEREHVFEPFYTTKPPGRGTGLGLAIVQRTVDELGGVVWVEQAREGGAAFKIFLPEATSA